MRSLLLIGLITIAASPAVAGGLADRARQLANHYGPRNSVTGLPGYSEKVLKDGSWHIEAAYRDAYHAVDVALYRAAERAKGDGHQFVQILSGWQQESRIGATAQIVARPSDSQDPPVCPAKKACYTADVERVLHILGGEGGLEPGVAIVDHLDEHGREVRVSGYGTGAIAWANGS